MASYLAKLRKFVLLFPLFLTVVSCQRNTVSTTPSISITYFGPQFMKMSTDTAFLEFSFADGAGDLGNDSSSRYYDIYIKDFRFDTGFAGYYFPSIDRNIEDPKYGLSGLCLFLFFSPNILNLRTDTMHMKYGDTTHFEIFIKDRAGNESNHITTPILIMRP